MVAREHRLLYQRKPGAAGTPRVWVLVGPHALDWYYHDLFHGCVTLRRTLELWAIEEWGGTPIPLTVTLTADGDLDFGGNADPEAARIRFHDMANRRPPPPGMQPRRSRDTAAPASDDAQAAAADAAAGARSSLGSGQGLLNRMREIGSALRSQNDRILVIVDELSFQLQRLRLAQPDAVLEAQMILRREWVSAITPANAHLVFLEHDADLLQQYIPPNEPGIEWGTDLVVPSKEEIGAALHRLGRRKGFDIVAPQSVAENLAEQAEGLKNAVKRVVPIATANPKREVNLETVLDLPPIDDVAVDGILAELDALTGLGEVKAKARELRARAVARRRRLAGGELPKETLHMVFTGNPGTGKTMVAEIFARLYHALGLLPTDKVKVVAPHDIIDPAQGRTTKNMERAIKGAVGGVLFIDEAHQFSVGGVGQSDDAKSREAANALVPLSWSLRNDLVIILAGYAQRMSGFFSLDEGLQRRFPKAGRVEFADYTPEQLWEMLTGKLAGRGWTLDVGAQAGLRRVLERRARASGFGNGGGVDNLVTEIVALHDARGDGTRILTVEDLPAEVVRHDEYLRRAEAELDQLVGIAPIRRLIDTLVHRLAYFSEEGRAPESGANGWLFVGPPGTGKTTVARLMAGLLYGHGAVRSEKFFETTGTKLQASFMGQSQAQVAEMMENYRGGVIFIDEAYSMYAGDQDMYGSQVVNTLVGELTHPDNAETVVILAGYENLIDELMDANPGLAGRFGKKLRFSNYSAEDCMEIARRMLAGQGYTAGEGLIDRLGVLAQHEMDTQAERFANARWVRTTLNDATDEMIVRVRELGLPPGDPRRSTIEQSDLPRDSVGYVDAEARPADIGGSTPGIPPLAPCPALDQHPVNLSLDVEEVS